MSEASYAKSLSDLGKRIERLFYFGSLIFLVGCINVYFVDLAKYVERENSDDIKMLISTMEKNFDNLKELFENPPKKEFVVNVLEDEKNSEVRQNLGLPPKEKEQILENKKDVLTYQDLLEKITDEIKYKARLSKDSLVIIQDSSKSPQEIMISLNSRRQQLEKRPVTIWGVESPLILPLQYGGARYQIPASFIAKSLSFALFPLFLGWLGSLYLTRHRELLLIRKIKFHGNAFPHILNIFSVAITLDDSIDSKINPRFQRRSKVENWIFKFMPSVIRSTLIVIFCAPMTILLAYCALQILSLSDEISVFLTMLVGFMLTCFFVQILALLIQEWVLLWNKTYYA